MNKIKTSIFLIGLGVLNFLHASLHIFQFFQSIFLLSYSTDIIKTNHSSIEDITHNPYLSILWAVIAVFTLYIGIRDFRHHRRCEK